MSKNQPKIEYIEINSLDALKPTISHIKDMPKGLYFRHSSDYNIENLLIDYDFKKKTLDQVALEELEQKQEPEETILKKVVTSNKKPIKKICIIGARKHTTYGITVVDQLLKEIDKLKEYFEPIIISGLATGIDTLALEGALKYGFKTIAIIGSGLDDNSIYPRENLPLSYLINRSGGIHISEYEPHITAQKYHFPKRNRLMAAFSDYIFIIEGSKKSGTLITAKIGLEFSKDIICIPGSIFSPLSAGPLSLISDGAIPLSDFSELHNIFGIHIEQGISKQPTVPLETKTDNHTISTRSTGHAEIKILKDEQLLSEKYYNCSEEELSILNILHEPRTRSEICEILQYGISSIQVNLIKLEIKGLVDEKLGKIVRL